MAAMVEERAAKARGDEILARSLGARVRALRERAGLDGTRLAELAGMKQAYLWRLEAGRTLPSIRSLARLALALELPLTELLTDVDYSGVALQPRSYTSPDEKD